MTVLQDLLRWHRGETLGWTGLIQVDGATYTWMGKPGLFPLANQTFFEYTSTRSIFILQISDVIRLNATFLSPVSPSDLKRQSLLFSYLNLVAESIDGRYHQVQIYSDISGGQWPYPRVRVHQTNFTLQNGSQRISLLLQIGNTGLHRTISLTTRSTDKVSSYFPRHLIKRILAIGTTQPIILIN